MTETIYSIVSRAGFSSNPSYYSGYAANEGDMKQTRLVEIYQSIKRVYGEEAGAGFVEMMKNISNLSPTYFLNELFRLAARNFRYQPPAHELPDGQKNVEASDFGSAFGTLMMKMGPPQRDMTEDIRSNFLWSIGERERESNEMPRRMRIEQEMRMYHNPYLERHFGYDDFPDDDY